MSLREICPDGEEEKSLSHLGTVSLELIYKRKVKTSGEYKSESLLTANVDYPNLHSLHLPVPSTGFLPKISHIPVVPEIKVSGDSAKWVWI